MTITIQLNDVRLFAHEISLVPASAPDASGGRRFTLYDGTEISV
jgi:hypothetical protein